MPVTAAVSAHAPRLLALGVCAPALTARGSNRRGTRGDHSRPPCDGATGGHLADSEAPAAQWCGFLHKSVHCFIKKAPVWALHKEPKEKISWCMFFNQPAKLCFSSPPLFPYSLVELNTSVTKISLSIKKLQVRFSKLQVRWHWFVLGFF